LLPDPDSSERTVFASVRVIYVFDRADRRASGAGAQCGDAPADAEVTQERPPLHAGMVRAALRRRTSRYVPMR
jgi:hypothetical protein